MNTSIATSSERSPAIVLYEYLNTQSLCFTKIFPQFSIRSHKNWKILIIKGDEQNSSDLQGFIIPEILWDEDANEFLNNFLRYLHKNRENITLGDLEPLNKWKDPLIEFLEQQRLDQSWREVYNAIQRYRTEVYQKILDDTTPQQTTSPWQSETPMYKNLVRILTEVSRDNYKIVQQLLKRIDQIDKLEMILRVFNGQEQLFFEMFQENKEAFLGMDRICWLANQLTIPQIELLFGTIVADGSSPSQISRYVERVAWFFSDIPEKRRNMSVYDEKRQLTIIWILRLYEEGSPDYISKNIQSLLKMLLIEIKKRESVRDAAFQTRNLCSERCEEGDETIQADNCVLWDSYQVNWWYIINETPSDVFESFFHRMILNDTPEWITYALREIELIFERFPREVVIVLLSGVWRDKSCSLERYHEYLFLVLSTPASWIVWDLKSDSSQQNIDMIVQKISQRAYERKIIDYPKDKVRDQSQARFPRKDIFYGMTFAPVYNLPWKIYKYIKDRLLPRGHEK